MSIKILKRNGSCQLSHIFSENQGLGGSPITHSPLLSSAANPQRKSNHLVVPLTSSASPRVTETFKLSYKPSDGK